MVPSLRKYGPIASVLMTFGDLPFSWRGTHNNAMPFVSEHQPRQRAERVSFDEATPVVLRFADGARCSGQLQVISVTGGLLVLPKPLLPGSIGKLMFLTQKGSVLGEAQMLTPMTWERQPFKFTSIHDDDLGRLQTVIQSRLAKTRRQDAKRSRDREEMENFRAW